MNNIKNIKRANLLFNGIYKIVNIVNNKFYIGSCSSKTFLYERLVHHREDLLKNKHCNKYLQSSFNKYGIENFCYIIIEKCEPKECLIKEQYYIDNLNPEYNLQKIAGSSFGRECNNETRKKISESNKLFWSNPDNKLKMKEAYTKRVWIKSYKKGYKRPNYKLSPEGVKRIKEVRSKKVINLYTGEIYESLTQAALELKLSNSMISMILNKKRNSPNINIRWKEE